MRSTSTILIFVMALCLVPGLHFGQFTIDYDNFPRPDSIEVTRYRANLSTFEAPEMGADLVWDYSGLESEEAILSVYHNAAGDPDYAEALYRTENLLLFQAFEINNFDYEGVDEGGSFGIGRKPIEVTYPITAITGGPNDRLTFVGGTVPFQGRVDYVQFPCTYGTSWEQTIVEDLPYQLTVAAFGLNQVPGFRRRYLTQAREITGYGKLILPGEDGTPNPPVDVLQMHVVRTTVDSIFLGGAPGPPPLMDAFGLSQGATARDEAIIYFVANDPSNAMRINYNSAGIVTSAFYRSDIMDVGTSTKNVQLAKSMAFPNPVAPSQMLSIQTDTPIISGKFELSDLYGRTIFSQAFDAEAGSISSLQMPYFLLPGTYIFQLLDSKGTLKSTGKLNVQ